MKIQKYDLLTLIFVASLSYSCVDELPSELQFNGYEFTRLDENAGNWNLILFDNKEDLEISPPDVIGSALLNQELQEVKTKIASATASQKEAVSYWTNNPLIRWNEIALELATKYNLIPAPNADGTYPSPDPSRPGEYPFFPYAHPPYTSRMLAYLSVAQYDGLIIAWHYKAKYGRPAPYMLDAKIKSAYDKNELNSFPSDGAVVAISAREILTAMFPLEKKFLEGKANEHLESLILAGINVKSDVDAGILIGLQVAKKALARATIDGMKNAQTNRMKSDSIKNEAIKKFGWSWENQESPKRHIGLVPLFGSVLMWNVPTVEEVRPAAPPSLGSIEFKIDAEELKRFAKNLTTEQRKIANFWNDGLNSYTPPGHWNRYAKEVVVKNKLSPVRTARVFAYLNMAIVDAGISCWDAKYYYHYPRPIESITGFKTILGTPNFPAYTSGHSTFSSAAAEVLSYFFPADANEFRKWAEEAAMSRVYGGIHYRFDAIVGLSQGKKVATYSIKRAVKDGAEIL